MKTGTWKKGKKTITGRWQYNWASDHFIICLDSIDRITGRHRTITVSGEKPEWNGWKLI